jgi:PKD repeat protein
MKRFLAYIALFFGALSVHAQSFSWVRGGGTDQNLAASIKVEGTYFMCTDHNGNVYALNVVGNTAITADTFYRPGGFGSPQNVLLTSHNCNGQMRFAKLFSCNSTRALGIVSDDFGHLYVALDMPHFGTGTSAMRLGYDTMVTTLTNSRVTLIQYDTVGHLNWFRFVGADLPSTYTNTGGPYNYLAMDGLNRPHLTAITNNGVVLSPTVASMTGYYDMTYNASGTLMSINRIDLDTTLWINGMTIDKQSGKQYIYGQRNYSAYPLLSHYSYIAALNDSRNQIWIDTISNPFYTIPGGCSGIAADGYGHLYAAIGAARGFVFRGDTAQNVFEDLHTSTTLMKMDTAGNPIWTRVFSATVSSGIGGVTLMPNEKILTAGSIAGGMTIAGTDTIFAYPGEGNNAIVAIVDSAGYVQSFKQLHGLGFYDHALARAADRAGNAYIGGKVENNIWAGSLSPYTSFGGESDFYIMKYGIDCSCTSMPVANYTHTGSFLNRTFTYTGTMAGIDSVRWTFGDGGTSTSMSPVHTYTGAGTYTTCVRVYSSCGNNMRCQEITVSCATSVSSNFGDTGVLIHGFTYTGTVAGYDSVVWDMGDGTTDTGINLWHVYAVADTYHVCATVYTNCGTHTFCKDVYIDVPGFVSDASLSAISIFPNPGSNELTVANVPRQMEYRLVNIVGVVMQQGVLQNGSNTIPVGTLPPGTYLVEMSSKDGSRKVARFVKE